MVNVVKKILEELEISFRILITTLVGLTIVIAGMGVFLKTHKDLAANAADYVLRPVVGSQITITIESYFFALEDDFNRIKYHFVQPDAHVFAGVYKPQKITSQFSLTPIPVAKDALPGEGVWTPIKTASSDALLAQTFLRPDTQRDYAIVALVKLNMQKLSINAVAGTWEPGEAAKRGPGKVPEDIQKSNTLIAAFNGGFQKKDGAYGMIVGNETYLPLQKGLATLVLYKDKVPQLFRYTGQTLQDYSAVRQNGPMLIENGKIVTSSAAWNMQTWGLTTTNTMYTWRSGLGITKSGDLIYAVGPSLVPETLALALQRAGATNAMQLDINPVWVRFVLYNSLGNGRYTYHMLLKDMSDGGLAYVTGYQKDFFYVYEKQSDTIKSAPKPLTIFTKPTPIADTFAILQK